jgi:hypothetical protein
VAVNAIVLSDPGSEAFGGSESSQKLTIQTNSSSSDQGDDESFSDDSPWSEESEYESAATNRYDDRPEAKAMDKSPQKDQREIPTLLRMISFLVVCLYRMPIRQFAVTEKIKARISDRASFYQHFDVLFVRDLFPKMDKTAATNLGRSISQRRSVLFYKDARDEQLEALGSSDSDSEPPAPAPAPKESITVDKTAIHKTLGQELALSESKSVTFTLPSKATTFIQKPSQQSWLYPPSSSVAISEKSIVSEYAAQELAIDIPKMPVVSSSTINDTFICPYCCNPQHVMSEILWEKHVFDDLKPYICTFPSCDLKDHLFADRSQWWQHEIKMHRFAWHCNSPHHRSHDDREDFIRHMREGHGTSFTNTQLDGVTSVFRISSEKPAGMCNLCFRYSTNLKSHVSRHLKRIALFALPKTSDGSDYTSPDVQGTVPLHPASDTATDCLVPVNLSSAVSERPRSIASRVTVAQEEKIRETNTTHGLKGKVKREPSSEHLGTLSQEFLLMVERGLQYSSRNLVDSWLQEEGVAKAPPDGMYHPFGAVFDLVLTR